jgi:Fic family protein
MTFLHELPEWPHFTWRSEALAALLAAVRHEQGRLLGKMESIAVDLRTEASVATLTDGVVKSSAIEGERLSPDEVRSSVARRLGLEPAGAPRARREVEGIVAMTLDATRNFRAPLTEGRLHSWHSSLFAAGARAPARSKIGGWRTKEGGPMQVVSGPIGREFVHFEAPGADRVAAEMTRFLEWFNAPLAVDPVLAAGIAHLWFVTIHPFADGNGRIARAIADMALARADATEDRFYGMSSQIEAERKDYYSRLEAAQRGNLDITDWLAWFLGCLDRAIARADRAFTAVRTKAKVWERISRGPVNDRQRRVIDLLLGDFEGSLTTSKYAKLTKCSADTALRDIRELVERGILVRSRASGRSTSYRLGDPASGLA